MTGLRASVLIVAFNSKRFLARQIEALARQSVRDFEVVLLDNASCEEERPTSGELPAYFKLVQSEVNLGFAGGNNHAARIATGEHLVLLNPDAFPAEDWLEKLLAAADAIPEAASIGCTQLRAEDTGRYDGLGDVQHAIGLAYRSAYGAPVRRFRPKDGETFSACGAAMLVRRAAFAAVGGFDERFFCYGEDLDLGFRLRLLGWINIQASEAVVHHVGGGSSGARSAFGDFHGARNRLWTFVKNMPATLFWPLLPIHLLVTGGLVLAYRFTGRGDHAWRGYLAGLAGLPAMFAARTHVQRGRTASTARIGAALTWTPLALVRRSPHIRPVDRPRKTRDRGEPAAR
ncbi:MAG: glycosyltransferase family 2 protein [Caulobacterales bacterium]